MYFKSSIFCFLNILLLTALGYKFFGIYNNFKELVKKIRAVAPSTRAPIHAQWIAQKLDHFDKKESRTWKMRVLNRLDLWKQNGPIYFALGGESEIDQSFAKTGLILELANETNGAIFIIEHRYYGESKPLKIRHVRDMKYLTTAQALADIAKIIRQIKKITKFKGSKVVVCGWSYSGNLAAWMKLVYPNLVDAAIASSAPVLAKRDFSEFLEVTEQDYKKYGSKGCLQSIQNMIRRYESLFKTKAGIIQLMKEEGICWHIDLTKPENKILFFYSKLYPFTDVGYERLDKIKDKCNNIKRTRNELNETDGDQFWLINRQCINDYDFKNFVKEFPMGETEYTWTYQTCTEYGYFQSTTSNHQHFTKNIPVEWFDKMCTAMYGTSFEKGRVIEGVRKINQKYGGRSPNVTEVVFVNGELDPWKSLSVLKDISKKAPAIYIPKGEHCSDFFPAKGDQPELKKARIRIKYLIKKWIGVLDRPKTLTFNLTLRIF